jgi:hypothetical protein
MIAVVRCTAALTLAIVLVACQTEVLTQRFDGLEELNSQDELNGYFGSSRGAFGTTDSPAPGSARPVAAAQSGAADLAENDWADSCAANLDEITGSLLNYYSAHQQLPPTLDAIPKISPSGAKISLSCPVSGKRYVYRPQGLRPPLFTDQNGDAHVGGILILYDPEPSHQTVLHLTDGTDEYDVKKAVHLGIVMQPRNGNPNQPLEMSVERIEPGILEMYLRNNPSSGTAPSVRPVTPVW